MWFINNIDSVLLPILEDDNLHSSLSKQHCFVGALRRAVQIFSNSPAFVFLVDDILALLYRPHDKLMCDIQFPKKASASKYFFLMCLFCCFLVIINKAMCSGE